MEAADIKRLLAQSKKEPVNCAVGVGKDGRAQIMLHKTKNPRALLKELEGEAGKLATPAFGSASVNVDEDPTLVILTLNKAPGGLGRRLKKSLAGTGFTKIEIRNEDGTVAEKDGGDEDAAPGNSEAAPAPSVPAAQPAASADLQAALGGLIKRIPAAAASDPNAAQELKQLAGAAVTAAKGSDPAVAAQAVGVLEAAIVKAEQATGGAQQATAPDLKAVQAELGQLIRQIQSVGGAQPDRLATLKILANAAANAIKLADAGAATKAVGALRQAIRQGSSAGPQKSAPIVIWSAAKEAVDGRINDLRKAVLAHPDEALRATLAQIADKGLNGVTGRASVGMLAAMTEAEAQPDKALKAVENFRVFLSGDIARGIDENPFNVAVNLRATMGDALEQITQRLAR